MDFAVLNHGVYQMDWCKLHEKKVNHLTWFSVYNNDNKITSLH